MRQFVIFLAGFALSLSNALIAMPKGSDFLLSDFLAVPLVCLLLALGNGIMAALSKGDASKIMNTVKDKVK